MGFFPGMAPGAIGVNAAEADERLKRFCEASGAPIVVTLTAAWPSHVQAETENTTRVSYPAAWPPPRVATTGIEFV